MIVKPHIKEFEKLGLGMFVHFGIYSVLGKGEHAKIIHEMADEEYNVLIEEFDPKPDWAKGLVSAAKHVGCKYITLTTRHHDGFSLYDTCGLNDFDAPHAKCGRDLVREFVDACREQDIIPFFYHTLLDWYEKSFDTDFRAYLKYLRDSVEILCTRYGKIGGLWFDGKWSRIDDDWEEDALYSMIRRYQPEAMIINNTGLGAQGEIGHIELDSVTFERGKPWLINMEGTQKYVASEMCEIFGNHWGYAKEDLNFKSPARIIEEFAECRRYGANMLINIGPMGDGSIRAIDAAMLGVLGEWVENFDEAIRCPRPCKVSIENKPEDFLLRDGKNYYLFCTKIPMRANPNVDWAKEMEFVDHFELNEEIESITWMDTETDVPFEQKGDEVFVYTEPYAYGRNLVVRVAKIVCR